MLGYGIYFADMARSLLHSLKLIHDEHSVLSCFDIAKEFYSCLDMFVVSNHSNGLVWAQSAHCVSVFLDSNSARHYEKICHVLQRNVS